MATILDPGARRALAARAFGGRSVTEVQRVTGGFGNESLRLTTSDGEAFLLRRHLRGDTAAVEAAVMARVRDTVPVPQIVYADPSGEILGTPVTVSRFVSGVTADRALDAGGDAARIGVAVGEVLARIGAYTFSRAGFFHGPQLDPRPLTGQGDLAAFVRERIARPAVADVLSAGERDAFLRAVDDVAPAVRAVDGARCLVHGDFNGKNLLVDEGAGGWRVTAVLDWEFAFSGSPLFDLGNLVRFVDELPAGFRPGVLAGFRSAGGRLDPDWERVSAGLDLFSIADLLTRDPDHPFFAKATAVARRIAARGEV
jgi:aminoglycoside phosphotransferase (APT) family kinase protein